MFNYKFNKIKLVKNPFITCLIIIMLIDDSKQNRSKRFLLFPRTSPTRVQIISGIGIPVSLNFESATIGYVLKAEYFLPENSSNILDIISDPFNPTERPLSSIPSRRRRDGTYERYDVEIEEIESGPSNSGIDEVENELDKSQYTLEDIKIKQPNNMATSRFTLYKGIEAMADQKGLNGRPCMLRSICESAEAQFSYSNGLLGELAHIIMSPSSTSDDINDYSDNEYLHAEQLGKSGAPCHQIFKDCPVSLLSQVSGVYNTVENLIKMFV